VEADALQFRAFNDRREYEFVEVVRRQELAIMGGENERQVIGLTPEARKDVDDVLRKGDPSVRFFGLRWANAPLPFVNAIGRNVLGNRARDDDLFVHPVDITEAQGEDFVSTEPCKRINANDAVGVAANLSGAVDWGIRAKPNTVPR